jgi:hypothetical protein
MCDESVARYLPAVKSISFIGLNDGTNFLAFATGARFFFGLNDDLQ